MSGTYYQPYKHGTLTKAQAKIMTAVGEKAYLRQIAQRSGYRSFQAVAALVESLVKTEVLQAVDV